MDFFVDSVVVAAVVRVCALQTDVTAQRSTCVPEYQARKAGRLKIYTIRLVVPTTRRPAGTVHFVVSCLLFSHFNPDPTSPICCK